jgi:hypothetical protein
MRQGLRLLIFVIANIFAQQLLAQTSACISDVDLKEIAKYFTQYQSLINNQKEYCESDLGNKNYQVLRSLATLKNITPQEPMVHTDDAFTYKAIQEKNWWEYFVQRADRISLPSKCQENVVAYVMQFFPGNINLCPLFFESNVTSQASVMLHEVRHFDGFSHVTCTRGSSKGDAGACDVDILDKGSYAVTAQTTVAMSFAKDISESERSLLQSEAIFTVFNRFNKLPKVKVTGNLLLSDKNGDVYNWDLENNAIDLLAQLKEPAKVYVSYSNLTIFPTNLNDSYRMDQKLIENVTAIGLYATQYNSESETERQKYTSISYLGTGGLLKANTFISVCTDTLFNKDLSNTGSFQKIINLSEDVVDAEIKSYLLSQNGELFSYECIQGANDIKISTTPLRLASPLKQNIEQLFSLNGQNFALHKDGRLLEIALNGQELIDKKTQFPFAQNNWLSVTPISRPEIF